MVSTKLQVFSLIAFLAQQCFAFAPARIPSAGLKHSKATPFTSASALGAVEVDEEETIFDPVADTVTDLATLVLRIGTCSLMYHHGIDKIQNVDGFSANVVAKFFGFLPGDPKFWTLSAAGTQVAGAGLLGLGVLARPVALSMMGTMLAAVVFHLLNTGAEGFPLAVVPQHSYNYELAAMYVCVLAYFASSGAGAYSVDNLVLGGELKLYEKAFNGIFGGEEEEEIITPEPPKKKGFFN